MHPQGDPAVAVVIGASGGIGAALVDALKISGRYDRVVGLGRGSSPSLDLLDQASVAKSLRYAAELGELRLVLHAAGVLHGPGLTPEKSLSRIDPEAMALAFAVNATGPALVMKHLAPLLPRRGRCVFAALSARVGSIGDNRLGGWYAYRASKAALNQLVHTAAIELARRNPEALCVALHPGTVATGLSAPIVGDDDRAQPPEMAARKLLAVLDALPASATGGFFDAEGQVVPW
ncbi:MAG: SDR family NAD(P)-dependent oxidoreductase [Brevundimonas sp.]|nr:SDR family NAD(P)-dependent oxidoreductase [Brevundimonas sp.]